MDNITILTIGLASTFLYLTATCATRKNSSVRHRSKSKTLPSPSFSISDNSTESALDLTEKSASVTPSSSVKNPSSNPVADPATQMSSNGTDSTNLVTEMNKNEYANKEFLEKMNEVTNMLNAEKVNSTMENETPQKESRSEASGEDVNNNAEENVEMKLQTAKKDEALGKTEQDVVLDATNQHFQFCVVEFKEGPTADLAAFVESTRIAGEQSSSYHWATKKRLDYDEGSWRLMARKLLLLKAEGFDHPPNTRQARELKESVFSGARKVEVRTQNALDKIKKGKEKSKRPGKKQVQP